MRATIMGTIIFEVVSFGSILLFGTEKGWLQTQDTVNIPHICVRPYSLHC
jgi:hypothetical protein